MLKATLSGREAYRLRLVNEMLTPSALMPRAEALLAQFAVGGAPGAASGSTNPTRSYSPSRPRTPRLAAPRRRGLLTIPLGIDKNPRQEIVHGFDGAVVLHAREYLSQGPTAASILSARCTYSR
jgi:enoyl-CoA hydratase/carnithine racemase